MSIVTGRLPVESCELEQVDVPGPIDVVVLRAPQWAEAPAPKLPPKFKRPRPQMRQPGRRS